MKKGFTVTGNVVERIKQRNVALAGEEYAGVLQARTLEWVAIFFSNIFIEVALIYNII